jgi:hypothetical protein
VFEQLLRRMDEDAEFDVDRFLAQHPNHAPTLRASLSHLMELGLVTKRPWRGQSRRAD